jgi:hypothetical protein
VTAPDTHTLHELDWQIIHRLGGALSRTSRALRADHYRAAATGQEAKFLVDAERRLEAVARVLAASVLTEAPINESEAAAMLRLIDQAAEGRPPGVRSAVRSTILEQVRPDERTLDEAEWRLVVMLTNGVVVAVALFTKAEALRRAPP